MKYGPGSDVQDFPHELLERSEPTYFTSMCKKRIVDQCLLSAENKKKMIEVVYGFEDTTHYGTRHYEYSFHVPLRSLYGINYTDA